MEEESMILRDLPVNTRNYTILDNVTGKPIDQENYSLTIDKEVINKLNKFKPFKQDIDPIETGLKEIKDEDIEHYIKTKLNLII